VVICAGGGGVPIAGDGRFLGGVPAVVDKDRVSAELALALGAEVLLMATGVPRVALAFGTPDQRWLDRLTVAEARRHLAAGQFPAGSMGPKIEALVRFVEAGPPGARGVVGSLAEIVPAWRGEAGTVVSPA
jgi:carbamate kinase